MEIADVDGSGTIDLDELQELVTKLNYDCKGDDLKTIFDDQDVDKTGELSKEQFGNAIFHVLKCQKHEEGNDEEDD